MAFFQYIDGLEMTLPNVFEIITIHLRPSKSTCTTSSGDVYFEVVLWPNTVTNNSRFTT